MNFENVNDNQNEKNFESDGMQVKAPNLDMDKIAASAELLTFFYWRNLSTKDYVVLVKHFGNAELELFIHEYDFTAGGRGLFGITTGRIKIFHENQSLELDLVGDKTDYYLWINDDGVMEYYFDNRYKDKNQSI